MQQTAIQSSHACPRRLFAGFMALLLTLSLVPVPRALALSVAAKPSAQDTEAILKDMTLDEKISQMIIPAIRTWDGHDVTDLTAVPELATALRAHQFCGVILFGQNVVSAEQTARLVNALQANNAAIENASTHIPYLMAADEEGGVVVRFTMGTRMTGSMAVGATGEKAHDNAVTTGRVLGEEMAALGFNVDFAPSIDVNSNPANPTIGVRSFGDVPARVSDLGLAFGAGLAQTGVIATYKHFPGHGDTGTDSHIDTAAVNKTIDEMRQMELAPFADAIKGGADLIMTAHITLPQYDDAVTFADGTQGYYPATMSHKVMTDLLRNEMGYQGVVITDGLEMAAIAKAKLVPGAEGSVEYDVNIAEKVINAGVDILLIPTDLNGIAKTEYYDAYIKGIANKVESGAISQQRIDESVLRILNLKSKYGVFDAYDPAASIDDIAARAQDVLGSEEHHADEAAIAQEAITLLKNNDTLPLDGSPRRIVFALRDRSDNVNVLAIIQRLQDAGILDEDVRVENLAADASYGPEDAKVRITIDYYLDSSKLRFSDELSAAVAQADVVVGMTKNWGVSALQATSAQYQGIARALEETHAAGGKFVLISGNLPYDVARYPEADAILCSYMSSGMDVDPTSRGGGATLGAYNANAVEAIGALFGLPVPQGTLPVTIYGIKENADATVSYDLNSVLFERGFGLTYDEPKSGWVFDAGAWYYYRNGSKVTGWLEDDEYAGTFYFDENGVMLTGWQWIAGDWYFLGTSGRRKTGWIWSAEYVGWYYLNEEVGSRTGAMLRNTVARDGSKVGPDGRWVA